MALKLSATHKQSQASSLATAIGTSAIVQLRDGTRPANPDTAATGTLLVSFTGNASQFGTASGGVITVSSIANVNASASGTPTWFRILTSGSTAVVDGDVSGDLSVSPSAVTSGQPVQFTSMTITMGG